MAAQDGHHASLTAETFKPPSDFSSVSHVALMILRTSGAMSVTSSFGLNRGQSSKNGRHRSLNGLWTVRRTSQSIVSIDMSRLVGAVESRTTGKENLAIRVLSHTPNFYRTCSDSLML